MPRFAYKAVTPAGQVVEGEVFAGTRSEVINGLHAEGHTPIRAHQVKEGALARLASARLFGVGHVSPTDVAFITQELATLLHAGLPLDRALALVGNLANAGAKRNFVNRILESVRSGSTLADAFERHKSVLPSFYVGMLRAGEAAGNLETVLGRLADILARAQALRESVRSAMYYPLIVLFVATASIVILLTAVVPEFRPLFDSAGAALPMSVRIIIAAGDFLRQYWWALAFGLCGVIAVLIYSYRQPAGRLHWDAVMLKMPVLGDLIAKVEVVRFSRTLGTLLGGGVAALSALSIAAKTLANGVVARKVADVSAKLKKGEGLGPPLQAAGVFPALAIQLILVGEEAGQLEAMLLRIADIYDEEVKRTLQRMLSLLVPLVTICLGLLVAAIIGSMLTAILSAYNLPA